MNDSTCLDAMQEQEHMLIEICKDIKWKDGDDHTLLLPFEMQIPFVWSKWTWYSLIPNGYLDKQISPNGYVVSQSPKSQTIA